MGNNKNRHLNGSHQQNQPEIPAEETNEETVEESIPENLPETPAEENSDVKQTIGVVTGCLRLNIRNKPSVKGEVVTEVLVNTRLVVDEDNSTKDWYKVSTQTEPLNPNVEGFCMKKFVNLIDS